MVREGERKVLMRGHSVMVDNRERVVFTGVIDVDSFNEDEVVLATEAGGITLYGKDLHIAKLSLEDGQLVVEGSIDAIDYLDASPARKGGMFSKLFK